MSTHACIVAQRTGAAKPRARADQPADRPGNRQLDRVPAGCDTIAASFGEARTIESSTDTSEQVVRAPADAGSALDSVLADGEPADDDADGTASARTPDAVWDRWILAVVALGALARFIGIARQSMWYDELFTVFAAMHTPAEIIRITATDTGMPLFYFVESAVMKVFGLSELSMRAVPALAGIATIWVIYLLGKRLFDAKTAFWAGTLFAIGLMPLRYAQEARTYAFLMLFAALGLLALLRLAEKPGWLNAGLFALVLTLTVYNHPYGLFGGTALVACMLGIPSLRRRCGWWGVGAAATAALLFMPWGLVTLKQMQSVNQYVDAGTWHLRPEKDVLGSFWAAIESFTPWPYPPQWAAIVFALVLAAGARFAFAEPVEPRPPKPAKRIRRKIAEPAAPVANDSTIVWHREDYTSATSVVSPADAAVLDPSPTPEPEPVAPDASGDLAFRLSRRDAGILLLVTMLLPIVAGLLMSVWVVPVQELRCFLIGLPAAYVLTALGAVNLKRWASYTLLGILVFSAILGAPTFYTERNKGFYREAVQYLLANDAQKDRLIVSSNFLPLNMNVYSVIEGYTPQFNLAAVKWWYQGEQLDEELRAVLQNRESVYLVTAFVPFTEGDSTAFDDSMSRMDGWKLVETRNFNNLPKVEHWVLGGSALDPDANGVPTAP